MPSRSKERRKAERDAAAAKTGAAGAAAALANLNVDPPGDWTTQAADPNVLFRALGDSFVKRKAAEGDREAQFSWGVRVMSEAAGVSGVHIGSGGRSPKAEAGLELWNKFPVAHNTEMC